MIEKNSKRSEFLGFYLYLRYVIQSLYSTKVGE